MNQKEDKVPEDSGCALHPSCLACPEPMCVYDFPGGPKAYARYKAMRVLLETGMDINAAAKELCIHTRTAQRRFVKAAGRKVLLT